MSRRQTLEEMVWALEDTLTKLDAYLLTQTEDRKLTARQRQKARGTKLLHTYRNELAALALQEETNAQS